MKQWQGKTVYVLGLGGSNQAACTFLKEAGANLLVWDDAAPAREVFPPEMVVAPEEAPWAEIAAVLKTPGIPFSAPAVALAQANQVPVVGDVDLLYTRQAGQENIFIGITGTNGKSTTTALVGHVLQQAGKAVAVGGNIGQAATTLPTLPAGGFYVLELSSYQLEMTADVVFDAAAILNLTPDHLERHGTMENYLAVKCRILKGCTHKILNGADPYLAPLLAAEQAVSFCVQTAAGAPASEIYVTPAGVLMDGGQQVADVSTAPGLKGPHNWQNTAAAWGLVRAYLSAEEFAAALPSFNALPHRMERCGAWRNIVFVNDSKATNAESTIPALHSYPHVVWLCGGKAKTEGITPCLKHLQQVRAAFTLGDSGDKFAAELLGKVPVSACGVLYKALAEAFSAAQKFAQELKKKNQPEAEIVVLFSPACASFDQFQNFEHRGTIFKSLVQELIENLAQQKAQNQGGE